MPGCELTCMVRLAQVTALGNPKLLERVSNTLKELHNLFDRFDVDHDGFITRDEFFRVRPSFAC